MGVYYFYETAKELKPTMVYFSLSFSSFFRETILPKNNQNEPKMKKKCKYYVRN